MNRTIDRAATKQSFDTDGYVHIRGFLPPDDARQVKARLDRFIAEIVPTLPETEVFFDIDGDAATIKSLTTLSSRDPYFQELFTSDRFLDTAAALIGRRVTPPAVHQVNKSPRIGKPTRPHQDAAYLTIPPGDSLTFWLALEPADAANGAMIYMRGSHRDGLRPHRHNGTNFFPLEVEDDSVIASAPDEVTIDAQPGDLIAHHALTIHRSHPNTSDRSRHALIADFVPTP